MTSRKIRGITQKLYVINYTTDGQKINVDIMGSSGNMYNLTITNKPICNCPDFILRQKRCKHIYYFLIKGLKLSDGDEDDDEYTDNEIKIMCKKAIDIKNNMFVDNKVKKKFMKNKKNFKNLKKSGNVKHKPIDDLCPICLDDLTDGNKLSFCEFSCGKGIHQECLDMYFKTTPKRNCIICNMPWNIGDATLPSYVNVND